MKKIFTFLFLSLTIFFAYGELAKITVITPNPATVNSTIIVKGYGFYGGSQNIWNSGSGGKSPGKVFLGDRELEVIFYSDTVIIATLPVGAVPGNITVETPQRIAIQGGFLDINSNVVTKKHYSFMEREEYLPPTWGYYYYGGGCGWNWFALPFGWSGWNMDYRYGEYPNVYYHRHRNDMDEEFFLGYMPYFGWSYFRW